MPAATKGFLRICWPNSLLNMGLFAGRASAKVVPLAFSAFPIFDQLDALAVARAKRDLSIDISGVGSIAVIRMPCYKNGGCDAAFISLQRKVSHEHANRLAFIVCFTTLFYAKPSCAEHHQFKADRRFERVYKDSCRRLT